MKSTKITGNENQFVGTFQLTIKSVTKSIEMPFVFSEANGIGQFKGSFTIDRRDYTIGGNSWTMGNNVTLNIIVNCTEKLL